MLMWHTLFSKIWINALIKLFEFFICPYLAVNSWREVHCIWRPCKETKKEHVKVFRRTWTGAFGNVSLWMRRWDRLPKPNMWCVHFCLGRTVVHVVSLCSLVPPYLQITQWPGCGQGLFSLNKGRQSSKYGGTSKIGCIVVSQFGLNAWGWDEWATGIGRKGSG